MDMPEVIARLNELYHKSRQVALSPGELAERDRLRKIYLGYIRNQVKVTLDSIEIVDEAEKLKDHHCNCDGHKH